MLVVVPTRGRPENAARLSKAFKETAGPNTDLLFCADANDPSDYEGAVPRHQLRRGTPARLGPWLNRIAVKEAKRFSVIGFMGDDHLPETPHWDTEIAQAVTAVRYGMAYGDDGYQHENLPTAVFMSADLITRLGWMVYPGLTHLYIDNHWKDIGEALNSLTYLRHVSIRHMHRDLGLAENDETYVQANSPEMWVQDESGYADFKRTVLPEIQGWA